MPDEFRTRNYFFCLMILCSYVYTCTATFLLRLACEMEVERGHFYDSTHNIAKYLIHVRLQSLWMPIHKLLQDVDGLLAILPVTGIQSLHQTIWEGRVLPAVDGYRRSRSPRPLRVASGPRGSSRRVSGASGGSGLTRRIPYSLQNRTMISIIQLVSVAESIPIVTL